MNQKQKISNINTNQNQHLLPSKINSFLSNKSNLCDWNMLNPHFNISNSCFSPIYPIPKEKESLFNQFFPYDNEINNSFLFQRKKIVIQEIEGHQLNNEQITIINSNNNAHILLNNQIDSLSTNIVTTGRTITTTNHILKGNGVTFSVINMQKYHSAHIVHNNVYFYINNSLLKQKDILLNTQLFMIYYSKSNGNFILQPFVSANNAISNSNMFLFIRLLTSMKIKGFKLLLIGDILLQVHCDTEKLIIVVKEKNENGNIVKKQKVFKNNNNKQQAFTVGRDSDCDFAFTKNKNLSKVHCSFMYDIKEKCWNVFDGDMNKQSTNGIWYSPLDNVNIVNDMEFKILGCSRCKINLYTDNK